MASFGLRLPRNRRGPREGVALRDDSSAQRTTSLWTVPGKRGIHWEDERGTPPPAQTLGSAEELNRESDGGSFVPPPDVPPGLSADGFRLSLQTFPAPFSPRRGRGLAGRVILLTAWRGNAAAKRISFWEASNPPGPPPLRYPIKMAWELVSGLWGLPSLAPFWGPSSSRQPMTLDEGVKLTRQL